MVGRSLVEGNTSVQAEAIDPDPVQVQVHQDQAVVVAAGRIPATGTANVMETSYPEDDIAVVAVVAAGVDIAYFEADRVDADP